MFRGVAVTVTQLSAFLAVVRHGSVTGAAEELAGLVVVLQLGELAVGGEPDLAV